MDPETVKKNEEIMKKKKAQLEAEKKAKEKEALDKAPAGKGKKDAKKGKKKWCVLSYLWHIYPSQYQPLIHHASDLGVAETSPLVDW